MTKPLSSLAARPRDPRLETAGDLEWLLTDGLGGFACNNVAMCAGRRYHGLLTAPLPGTATRHLYLAALVERVATAAGDVIFGAPRVAGDDPAAVPEAFESFELAPWPRTHYGLPGGGVFTREILMPTGEHAVYVRYTANVAARLELRPLVAFREADHQTFANDVLRETASPLADGIELRPYDGLPAMALTWDAPVTFAAAPDWWRGVEYAVDLERGYGGHEDLFCPGLLEVELVEGESVTFAAKVDGVEPAPAAAFDLTATARLHEIPDGRTFADRCAVAADDFLYVGPGDRLGILAGFPWFVEWGRDTFLSLPGLTLARGQLEPCEAVLIGALEYLKDGLLPNIFAGTVADSHYGSVDASLWFARAVLLYARAGGDEALVRGPLQAALVEIAECYRDGTAPDVAAMGIRGDADGLLRAGTPGLNPTWMDAKPESGAVTPRDGCPVEIAALWCSLLAHLAELEGGPWQVAAERAQEAFVARFWLADEGYLADVWRPDGVDASVRPNMVLAAALEFCPLTAAQRQSVFDRARRDLLTPVGLRTLAPDDPQFVPRYRGGPEERDRAYHQGTVWPWLLGGYVELGLRAGPGNRAHLVEVLEGLAPELDHGGLEHLNEVYDGNPPHGRGGTFAQAWNTAEVLRALAMLEDDA